jgi:ArsR family transcriptional regulator, arsenate/arsenite/antimonite-responsive transcriptional repressor
MNALISFGKALSDPTRIRILHALLQCELCVCELVDALDVSQSTLSTHLQSLRSSGVVVTVKRQTWIIYDIDESYRDAISEAIERFPVKDTVLVRDRERIANRLKLRIDGCCVIGSRTLKKEKEYIYVNN